MKKAKQVVWFQILVIICLCIGCKATEDNSSNTNRNLEKITKLADEIENTEVEFGKLPPGQNEDVDNGNDESEVLARRRVKRIIGGRDAGPTKYPWMARITYSGPSSCGGALINSFFVLTAAHCIVGKPLQEMKVTLGVYNISVMAPTPSTQKFNVSQSIVHHSYKAPNGVARFDVALLRLDRRVDDPSISPINLPDKDESFVGQIGWVAGWGAQKEGSSLRPHNLQEVDVRVIDNASCKLLHEAYGTYESFYDDHICAGHPNGGKDACNGDSGGPLMGWKNGKWYLIGIVSFAYGTCAEPGHPGIYHNVAKTVDWIKCEMNSTISDINSCEM